MIEIKTGIFETTNSDTNIYLVGDIHGDYQCLVHCLVDLCDTCIISEVSDDDEFKTPNREWLSWKPGCNSTVIFCGDLIHRKRYENNVLDDECSDVFIIKLLLELKEEAIKNQGNILIIAGNHEILNITDSNNETYTSDKNKLSNRQYFTDTKFINKYIANSYAWIKINKILVAHGGLCSDYLTFLDELNIFKDKIYSDKKQRGGEPLDLDNGDGVVSFVNNKYREFFTNFKKSSMQKDSIGFNLFIKYDILNKKTLNVFWCREWGFSGVNCTFFKEKLSAVGCDKMIIAHCPQFISPDYPKMINFECIDTESNVQSESYNIARIDLGMSRCFDYNHEDNFLNYLSNNYNRKMSVLKLNINHQTNTITFNVESVITKKLSCIQYLLLKYGLTKEKWEENNISSNWLGFDYLRQIIGNANLKSLENRLCSCNKNSDRETYCKEINVSTNIKSKSNINGLGKTKTTFEELNSKNAEETVLCLLYPIINCEIELDSIKQFRKQIK